MILRENKKLKANRFLQIDSADFTFYDSYDSKKYSPLSF